jgi:hypothetical protein
MPEVGAAENAVTAVKGRISPGGGDSVAGINFWQKFHCIID